MFIQNTYIGYILSESSLRHQQLLDCDRKGQFCMLVGAQSIAATWHYRTMPISQNVTHCRPLNKKVPFLVLKVSPSIHPI